MSACLYYAVSEKCKAVYGATALKIGFSSRGPEVRQKGLREEGYGGYKDFEIVVDRCEWLGRECLNPDQLESVEDGVIALLVKGGSTHPCPGADEIILAETSDVIAAFQWAKRRVRAGTWDFDRRRRRQKR